MARLTQAERDKLPARAFALPKERKYPVYRLEGSQLVPDAGRARSAERFASMLEAKGKLSKAKASKVRAKARDALRKAKSTTPKRSSSKAKTKAPKRSSSKAKTSRRRSNPEQTLAGDKMHKGRAWRLPRWEMAAELGRVVDLDVRRPDGLEYRHRYSGASRPLMLWHRPTSTLFWVYQAGAKLPALRKGAPRDKGHAEVFERFHADGREADGHRRWSFPAGATLYYRGRAVAIGYDSDKFGESSPKRYDHRVTSDVRVFYGEVGRRHVVALRGGRLRVTARGIEG